MMSKFYTFYQNNIHGDFILNDNLTTEVIVEAHNADEANERFKALGGYFNGLLKQIDCPCCGDRWQAQYKGGTETPTVFDVSVWSHKRSDDVPHAGDHFDFIIHYLNGGKVSGHYRK